MTEMGMSALYLIRSTVVVSGDGSSARLSDLVRLKRKVLFRLASAGRRWIFIAPVVSSCCSDVGLSGSSRPAESVRLTVIASSSERPSKSLKPESLFWPELSVPTLDKVDCDLTTPDGSVDNISFNFIGSSWTLTPPTPPVLPPSET